MRTLVRVENANCTYCWNEVRDDLLARPQVRDVQTSVIDGCIEVEHDGDPSAITALLHQSLHGWEVASNGEIVMVLTNPVLSEVCTIHG